MDQTKIRREGAITLFLLFSVTLLVYSPYWMTADLTGFKDQFYQDHTLRVLASQQWRSGEIPLWNPWNFTGDPLAGQIYVGVFYWPNIVYLILPPVLANKFLVFFAHLVLGFGVWLLLRDLLKEQEESQPGSNPKPFAQRYQYDLVPLHLYRWIPFMGALTAVLLATRWYTQSFTGRDTMIWLPWMMLSLDRLWSAERKGFTGILTTVFFWSTGFLAGHAHIWFYLALTSFIWVLFRHGITRIALLRSLLAGFIFFLVVSPQLVATYPMAIESPRLHPQYCHEQYRALPPDLWRFFVPGRNSDDYIPANAYILPLLMLAPLIWLFSGSSKFQRLRLFGGTLVIMGLIFGVTPLPCYVPILRNMRTHMRYMATGWYVVLVMVSMLFLYDLLRHNQPRILQRKFLIITIGTTLIYGLTMFLHRLEIKSTWRLMDWLIMMVLLCILFVTRSQARREGLVRLAVVGSFVGVMFSQGLELHHLIRIDLSTAYWKTAEKMRHAIKDSSPEIQRWFAYTHQDEPWTGIEANLNAVDRIDQASIYPGAVGNYMLDHLVMVMARWQPEIWHLLGAEATVVPVRAYREYERYRLLYLSKHLNLARVLPEGSRGCFWFKQSGGEKRLREGMVLAPVEDASGKVQLIKVTSDGQWEPVEAFELNTPYVPVCSSDGKIVILEIQPSKAHVTLRWWNRRVWVRKPERRFLSIPEVEPAVTIGLAEGDSLYLVRWEPVSVIIQDAISGAEVIRAGKRMIDLLPFTFFQPDGEPYWFAIRRPLDVVRISRQGSVDSADFRIPLHAFMMKFYQHILNTRWVYRRHPQWHRVRVIDKGKLEIWHYKGPVFPFAWYVRRTIHLPWEQFKQALLLGGIGRWSWEAAVNKKTLVMKFPRTTGGSVKVIRKESHRFTLRLRGKAGLVVIRLRPYPCWTFTLDGTPVQSFRVNYVMQAVRVPEGTHTLEGRCSIGSLYRFTSRHLANRLRGKVDRWDRFYGL